MKLWRVTFKIGDTLHSTTFVAMDRAEAVKDFNTWADGIEHDVKFIACVEVK